MQIDILFQTSFKQAIIWNTFTQFMHLAGFWLLSTNNRFRIELVVGNR